MPAYQLLKKTVTVATAVGARQISRIRGLGVPAAPWASRAPAGPPGASKPPMPGGGAAPKPSTVAKNIGPRRPTAKPATAKRTGNDSPGAKLPPRRS